jgi:polyisoprenoid-binding protein YceI
MTTDSSNLPDDYELNAVPGFAARQAMVTTVRGSSTGRIRLDGAGSAQSTATVEVDVASLSTDHDQRDGRLPSVDFSDVATYPTITFTSTDAERSGDDSYRLTTRDLAIRDVTGPVTLELSCGGSATDPHRKLRVGLEISATINRKDFGFTWNTALENGGLLVGDKVNIELDISTVKSNLSALRELAGPS